MVMWFVCLFVSYFVILFSCYDFPVFCCIWKVAYVGVVFDEYVGLLLVCGDCVVGLEYFHRRHFRLKHFRRRNIVRMEHWSDGTLVERNIGRTEHSSNGIFV